MSNIIDNTYYIFFFLLICQMVSEYKKIAFTIFFILVILFICMNYHLDNPLSCKKLTSEFDPNWKTKRPTCDYAYKVEFSLSSTMDLDMFFIMSYTIGWFLCNILSFKTPRALWKQHDLCDLIVVVVHRAFDKWT